MQLCAVQSPLQEPSPKVIFVPEQTHAGAATGSSVMEEGVLALWYAKAGPEPTASMNGMRLGPSTSAATRGAAPGRCQR